MLKNKNTTKEYANNPREQKEHVREKLDEIYRIAEREIEWVLSNSYPLRAKIIKDKINQAVPESIQVLDDDTFKKYYDVKTCSITQKRNQNLLERE